MIRSSGRVSQVCNGNRSGEVTFDAQYEGNYVTVTAKIDTTPGGLLRLGKRDLWELGLDTTVDIAARALRASNTETTPIKGEDQDYSPAGSTGNTTGALIEANLFKPMIKGWKREVVFRKNSKTCDVYYEAPASQNSGNSTKRSMRKKRSTKDIARHFAQHPDNDLQVSDFCYEKRPLGILCNQYETVRNANEKPPISSETLEYCPIHANFTRGTCPILNITNDNGMITWEHKAMVNEKNTEPTDRKRSWDVNLGTGKTTHNVHPHRSPRKKRTSIESETTESDEDPTNDDSPDKSGDSIIRSMKQECSSEEDATTTFTDARFNHQQRENQKYDAAGNKIGDAEMMKMILQDCLRILDVRDTDEERESQDGGEHDLRSVSDLGEGGETCRTEHT